MLMFAYILSPFPTLAYVAVSFTNTVTLGSVVLGALISIATVITLMYGAKYKSLAEQQEKVIDTLEAGVQAWKETSERHEIEKKASMELVAAQKQQIAKLEALPNLAIILDKMAEKEKRQDEVGKERLAHALELLRNMNEDLWAQHEAHANRRSNELIEILRENQRVIRLIGEEVKRNDTQRQQGS